MENFGPLAWPKGIYSTKLGIFGPKAKTSRPNLTCTFKVALKKSWLYVFEGNLIHS